MERYAELAMNVLGNIQYPKPFPKGTLVEVIEEFVCAPTLSEVDLSHARTDWTRFDVGDVFLMFSDTEKRRTPNKHYQVAYSNKLGIFIAIPIDRKFVRAVDRENA